MLIVNDIIAFVLEGISVILLVTWAYSIPDLMWKKILFGIIALLLFAMVWGTFFSPKATYPLKGSIRWILEFLVLFLPYLRFIKTHRHYVILGGILILVNLFIQSNYGRSEL